MKKDSAKKKSFQCFYIPEILFDSVCRKDENYYPKMFLEKIIHNFVRRNIRNFGFLGFGSSIWNIKNFFGVSVCWNIRIF